MRTFAPDRVASPSAPPGSMPSLPQFGDLFADRSFHSGLFQGRSLTEALAELPAYAKGLTGGVNDIRGRVHSSAVLIGQGIHIDETAFIDAGVLIQAPAYIGRNVLVGHGALVRQHSIIGHECVLGHATEVKDIVMFPRSKAGHFNFIGDSIIGANVNFGGGTIVSNFEFAREDGRNATISIRVGEARCDTKLMKMGAFVGDGVSTGANSVLSPGCIVGKNSYIYPSYCARKGVIPPKSRVNDEFYAKKDPVE